MITIHEDSECNITITMNRSDMEALQQMLFWIKPRRDEQCVVHEAITSFYDAPESEENWPVEGGVSMPEIAFELEKFLSDGAG